MGNAINILPKHLHCLKLYPSHKITWSPFRSKVLSKCWWHICTKPSEINSKGPFKREMLFDPTPIQLCWTIRHFIVWPPCFKSIKLITQHFFCSRVGCAMFDPFGHPIICLVNQQCWIVFLKYPLDSFQFLKRCTYPWRKPWTHPCVNLSFANKQNYLYENANGATWRSFHSS